MVSLLIWLLGFLCPNPSHTIDNHGNCSLIHVSASSTEDTGGETGDLPPKPPVPPPPPPPGN